MDRNTITVRLGKWRLFAYGFSIISREPDEMDSSQQLVSNYVRSFVENDGGSLRFSPIRDEDGRMCWELYGILPDGTERKVMLSKTGRPRIFKSSDAVIAYWLDLYPEASEITIPVLPSDNK